MNICSTCSSSSSSDALCQYVVRKDTFRKLNLARSKPNAVDRPVRTARTFVHHYNSTQYCIAETVLLIFSFFQTNITSQMWPIGDGGTQLAGDHSDYSTHEMKELVLIIKRLLTEQNMMPTLLSHFAVPVTYCNITKMQNK